MSTTFADPADDGSENIRRKRRALPFFGYSMPESQTARGYEDVSDFVDEDGFFLRDEDF